MSKHETHVSLRHMLDHAREAVAMAQGRSRRDLATDRMFGLAMIRLLEIVGEAASRVPTEDRTGLPEVPWRSVVGLRNRLIHAYDFIDYDIVWDLVRDDLPPLVASLEAALRSRES